MFKGSIVALVTPMQTDGSIDYQSLDDLVEWHIASETAALVIAGTTGESPTLTSDEQFDIISRVVKQVADRIPIIAGTGSCSTQHTIDLTRQAKKAGAVTALVITPYYNKPTQQGLYEHYKMVADKGGLPIILYNVPGRTACDILPDTVERLSKITSIIAIKEATGKLARTQEILERCGKSFGVYSGDDAVNCDLMLNGARGVISVTANVHPRKMHDFCEAALAGDRALAQKLDAELQPLHKKLFLETNPIPVKWALKEMGKISAGIRLPLLELDAKYHAELRQALQESGVLGEKAFT